jgi:1-acyl-sn-glycerol-3-phosphate acyltransferase
MGYKKWKVVFAKGEKRIPFVVTFLKYIGIPFSREELRSKKETSDKVISYLKEQDGNILVFPEGRRLPVEKREDLIMAFHHGAFRWSYECDVPIIPVVVSWTFLFKPRSGQWWFSPRTITINYLDPVLMREHESIDDFSQRIRESMLIKLKEELKK